MSQSQRCPSFQIHQQQVHVNPGLHSALNNTSSNMMGFFLKTILFPHQQDFIFKKISCLRIFVNVMYLFPHCYENYLQSYLLYYRHIQGHEESGLHLI